MVCDHSGPHSGALRYLRTQGQLRLVIVCDDCGEECAQLGEIEYRMHACTIVDGRDAGATTPVQRPTRAIR